MGGSFLAPSGSGGSRRSLLVVASPLSQWRAPYVSALGFPLCKSVSVVKLPLRLRTPGTLGEGPPSGLHLSLMTSAQILCPNKVTV